MIFCRKQCIIAIIFFLSTAFTLHAQSMDQADSSAVTTATMSYANVHAQIIIYTSTAAGKIDNASVGKLKHALDIVREFFWLNSRCRLNLQITYNQISDHKPVSFFPRQGALTYPYVKNDIMGMESTNLVIVLIPALKSMPPLFHEKIGDKLSFASIPLPAENRVPYPISSKEIDNTVIWALTWAVHQTLAEQLGAALPVLQHVPAIACSTYPAIADRYRSGVTLKNVMYEMVATPDNDQDGLPDADSLVVMDERRFGSDSGQIDSDNDGLSDLLEYSANFYTSASPQRPDSDFDRISDGNDRYPTNPTPTEIPQFTPNFNGDFRDWFWLTDVMSFSTTEFAGEQPLKADTYMNWDNNALYLANRFNAPAEVSIYADIGNDGWNVGANNYHFQVDPFSDRFSEIHVLDMTERSTDLSPSSVNGTWDDEPLYYTRYGRLVDEFNVRLSTHSTEQFFEIRMSIPASELPDNFLQAGHQLGLQIHFKSLVNDQWASIFPPYYFYILTLK
ncbi:hypothetical protein JW960_15825 [candidate division KSB1 bacterium]|nr:hypothetical protein [candidate division KSB1 bacterium]